MIRSAASKIAHALGGHKAGAGFLCKCVVHDDKNPSLSVADGEDGSVLVHCFAGCDANDVIAELDRRSLWPERPGRYACDAVVRAALPNKPSYKCSSIAAAQIWSESVDPRNTWAEEYLAKRGIGLSADSETLLRSLRFHPCCAWKDVLGGNTAYVPALIAAFEPIAIEVPGDPFFDPRPTAIHRIRGRGHEGKRMLGPAGGCAVMISPWWEVQETLHVAEGIETALALYGEGRPHKDQHRPIWAVGSAGALKALPVIGRVRRLVIWADNDRSGTGVEAARACVRRWSEAGKHVVIRYLNEVGADYADVA